MNKLEWMVILDDRRDLVDGAATGEGADLEALESWQTSHLLKKLAGAQVRVLPALNNHRAKSGALMIESSNLCSATLITRLGGPQSPRARKKRTRI